MNSEDFYRVVELIDTLEKLTVSNTIEQVGLPSFTARPKDSTSMMNARSNLLVTIQDFVDEANTPDDDGPVDSVECGCASHSVNVENVNIYLGGDS